MKRFITCAFALVLAGTVLFAATPKETETPASDKKITFVGRTLTQGNDVSFDWTGVYVKVKFTGSYLAIKVSDTGKNLFNVWLDKPTSESADKLITTEGNDSVIVLFDENDFKAIYGKKLPTTPHEVIIKKRNEGEQGTTTIHSFVTKGEILQSEGLKARMIEFIGDSYTCGYGTEGLAATERFRPETENSNYSYAAIVSRYFDADYYVVAHSGMGICRNYNDKFADILMPDRYENTFDMNREIKWDASKSDFKPAVTVILLGTNDFSVSKQPSLSSWKNNYTSLLKKIKANYGDNHPILCQAAKGDYMLYEYIREAVQSCGLTNVYYMGYGDGVFSDSEYGSDWHPNYSAHKKISSQCIPYISTLTGWPLEAKEIK